MRETVQRILDEALQGNETSNFELEIVTKTGDRCFMLVNATTRRDPEFNVVGGKLSISYLDILVPIE